MKKMTKVIYSANIVLCTLSLHDGQKFCRFRGEIMAECGKRSSEIVKNNKSSTLMVSMKDSTKIIDITSAKNIAVIYYEKIKELFLTITIFQM